MKRLYTLVCTCVLPFLSGCSWSGSFYIFNLTTSSIYVEFELINDMYGNHAFLDTVIFYEAEQQREIELYNGTGLYEKEVSSETTKYSFFIQPGMAASGGSTLSGFSFDHYESRHGAFKNVSSFKLVRSDSKDTVSLSPAYLADFSRQIGKWDIGLVLD